MSGDERTCYLQHVAVGDPAGDADGWQQIVDTATGVVYAASLFTGPNIPRLDIAQLIDAGERA